MNFNLKNKGVMPKEYEYKKNINDKFVGFYTDITQYKYVQKLDNISDWFRWLIDNDPGYKKSIKKEKEVDNGGGN